MTGVQRMAHHRWIVVTKRRRLTLRGMRPRFERAVLTAQSNPIDAGAWLDEYHRAARAGRPIVPYVIVEHLADGIAPVTYTDPTELINFSREAHDPRVPVAGRLARRRGDGPDPRDVAPD